MPPPNGVAQPVKRKYIIIPILALLIIAGCNGAPKPSGEKGAACSISDVTTDVNNESMVVSWNDNCGQLISGYNIYISEEPLVETYPDTSLPESIEPHNQVTYPGDTDPGDPRVHYEAEGLENGVKYYVSVRVVYGDQSLSEPSEEIVAVCAPRGQIELGVRYSENPDGFSFVEAEYTDADDTNNDIYFYTVDGDDFLASPMRLGFLKDNRLRTLPYSGDIEEVAAKVKADSELPSADKVQVAPGDWIWVYMPDQTTALVQVREFSGSGENRQVSLYFAYFPLPNELII